MKKKVAIVTGASSGFGLLTVIELAKSGFDVIATMRDLHKSELLIEKSSQEKVRDFITLHELDVTSKESIHVFKEYCLQFSSIDVLVNNAGLAIGGFHEDISVDDYRAQFETNFFGVIAVTQAILPLMRTQRSGRIINMSSISGKMGFPGLSPYVASKHALEGFSESLSLEVQPFGIDVILIEPGSYQTNIWSAVDAIERKKDTAYQTYMTSLLSIMNSSKSKYGDPTDVAKLIAKIASQTKKPHFRYPIGVGVKRNLLLKNVLPWRLIEKWMLRMILNYKLKE
ncbi:SDR family oxidoreductase [Niallia sp. XMNu-256]|uniref:SDR family oxidoreductase n=1 Tax=Niallia sp. XMNu-256 TaxID=3082444 RepID=UPI0030CC3114